MEMLDLLYIIYVACILFPIVFTNVLFLNSTTENVKKREIQQLDTTMERAELSIKKSIEDVIYLSNIIYTFIQIMRSL